MRKMPVILFGFLLATLISMSTISMVQAGMGTHWWVDPEFRGDEDEFFHDWIVAYVTGTTAKLCVPFINDYGRDINVSSVRVWFDWGEAYNSTECSKADPVEIEEDGAHTFTITFTVPSTTIASNLVLHDYKITVEYDTSSYTRYRYDEFAVFSADQADALELEDEYDETDTWWYYFESAEAQSLASQAHIEGELGYTYLHRGDFANAKTHFEDALELYDDAFAAEEDWGTTYQETMLNATKTGAETGATLADAATTEADAAVTSADAAMNQSYGWILFGLGFILVGIGAIIYAVKKPKAA